jgi:hypothetical protein
MKLAFQALLMMSLGLTAMSLPTSRQNSWLHTLKFNQPFQPTLQRQEAVSCDVNPCKNEGTCQVSNGMLQCVCPWGFTGILCETCLTDCVSNPCPQNKRCRAKFGGGFDCVCPPDRAGQDCELLNDLCSSMPCQNNGQCRAIEGGSFTCDCHQPWAGTICEESNLTFCFINFCAFFNPS